MAKKSNDAIYDDFIKDVLANVSTDVKADVEKVLKLDSVSSKAKEAVLARSDYSRFMDDARTQLDEARTALNSEVTEARKNIDGWKSWYENATKEFSTTTDKLKQYEDEYGPIATDGSKRTSKSGLTEEAFTKRLNDELQKHDLAAISFANDLSRVQFDYFKHFNEVLDTDKLIESATKKQQSLKDAYTEFIGPKVKEREEKRFNDAISKAKEEGAREALATHKLPFVSGPSEPHTADLMAGSAGKSSEDRVSAAIAQWNTIRSGATP